MPEFILSGKLLVSVCLRTVPQEERVEVPSKEPEFQKQRMNRVVLSSAEQHISSIGLCLS